MKTEAEDTASRHVKEKRNSKSEEKVVVHLEGGQIVKGFLPVEDPKDLQSVLERPRQNFQETITVFSSEDRSPVQVDLSSIKAMFFVNSFTGNSERNNLRYYIHGPEVGAIWVEVQFKDDEIMEGTVHNSIHHLIADGFFLHPSDPGSNNRLVYIPKSAIKDYRVLGVRTLANG
jgi:hypothetical protein